MRRLVCGVLFAGIAAGFTLSAQGEKGEKPFKLADVASAKDIAAEAADQKATLAELLEDEQSFTAEKKPIAQAAGVLAVLGQALAEHPDASSVKIHGADLREAARKVIQSKSHKDAVAGLAGIDEALAGKSSGTAEKEYAWNKLINLHRMMEEFNDRNSKLRRVIRRPNDAEADSRHATTLALLAIAMHADTHEVKKESEIPKWQGWSLDFQQNMTHLATALKKQDADMAKMYYTQSLNSCKECHAAFRH